jgi:hypothetical protein
MQDPVTHEHCTNKDNAIRQMNDNSSGAFLQVSEGWQRGCWRKCYRGTAAALGGLRGRHKYDGEPAHGGLISLSSGMMDAVKGESDVARKMIDG